MVKTLCENNRNIGQSSCWCLSFLAYLGPNLMHHRRINSWVTSISFSANRSSMSRWLKLNRWRLYMAAALFIPLLSLRYS